MNENIVKNISELERPQNPVYGKMFLKNKVVENWISEERLFRSWVSRGQDSKFSYNSFGLFPNKDLDKNDELKDNIMKTIVERFSLRDGELFKSKFQQAVSGNGNEWMKITTLHSSSLLALLCFYSVSDENPLYVDGGRYTESFFEVKTPVKGNSSYSNMDVVLKGEKDGNKVLLFLESKFCEYLQSGKCDVIKNEVYCNTYTKLGFDLKGEVQLIKPLKFKLNDETNTITISSSERYYYCKGVKQMLSHYIGISNFVRGENGKLQGKQFNLEDEKVLLGEIIYRLPEEVDTKGRFEKYKNLYTQLADVINNSEEKPFKMNKDILTYQDIFGSKDFILDQKVRDFYRL